MDRYFNIGAKYDIIGRVINGREVVAYIVKDKLTESEQVLEKGILEQLALNKQIYNCAAQLYNNTVVLKGINCKISQLPKYSSDDLSLIIDEPKELVQPSWRLVGKVQHGRRVTAYMLVSLLDSKTLIKLSKEEVLNLAKDGHIANAKVQRNGKSLMLRGTPGNDISQLRLFQE